jgi:predicted ester cyclase
MFAQAVSQRCRSARKAEVNDDAADDRAPHETIVRRLFDEVHNQKNTAAAHEIFGSQRALKHLRHCLALVRTAAPVCWFTVDEIIELGDKAITRWTANLLLAGRPVQASGLAVFRFLDGKIVGVWQNWDELRILVAA